MQTTCAVKGQRLNCRSISACRRRARGFVGDFLALAKQVFLLRFVELLQRQRGGFDVEYEFGHVEAGLVTLLLYRLASWAAARG